jgi:hypothetical protein
LLLAFLAHELLDQFLRHIEPRAPGREP